jgi:hypothetical protein
MNHLTQQLCDIRKKIANKKEFEKACHRLKVNRKYDTHSYRSNMLVFDFLLYSENDHLINFFNQAYEIVMGDTYNIELGDDKNCHFNFSDDKLLEIFDAAIRLSKNIAFK